MFKKGDKVEYHKVPGYPWPSYIYIVQKVEQSKHGGVYVTVKSAGGARLCYRIEEFTLTEEVQI